MELNNFIHALQSTFTATSAAARRQAEAQIAQYEKLPGFMQAVFQIVVTPQVDLGVRQAAVVFLKNHVKGYWKATATEEVRFSDADKAVVRAHLLLALNQSPPLLRSHLATVITTVAEHDFPARWPDLLDQIRAQLASPDASVAYHGIIALNAVIENWQFLNTEEQKVLMDGTLRATLPAVGALFQKLVTLNEPAAGEMLLAACKTFSKAIYGGVVPYLRDDAVMTAWADLMIQLIVRDLPEEMQPKQIEDRLEFGWWRAKKVACSAWHRLFVRVAADEGEDYQQHFQAMYAAKLLGAYLQLLDMYRRGHFMTNKVLTLGLRFINQAIRMSITFRMLKPHINALLCDVLLPLCAVTAEDLKRWQEDPQEFLREEFDPHAEYYSPRLTAAEVLVDILQLRSKDHFNAFVARSLEILAQYQATPIAQRNFQQKDGVLFGLGSINFLLKKRKATKHQLAALLMTHVLPELASPHAFLRAKACWCLAQFWDAPLPHEVWRQVIQMMLQRLKDEQLPVRVHAMLAMKYIVQSEVGSEALLPILPQLVNEVLVLMQHIDNDMLVQTLEVLIERFGDEVVPFAVQLCTHLAQQYLAKSAEEQDDDDDDAAVACMEMLNTMSTLLEHVGDHADLYPQLEAVLAPMLLARLNKDQIEYIAELLQVAHLLGLLCPPRVTPALWAVFARMLEALDSFAFDYIDHMVAPCDNLISKDPEGFLASGLLDPLMHLFRKMMLDQNFPEPESGEMCKMVEVVLFYCKGRVDHLIPAIFELVLHRYQTAQSELLLFLLFSLITGCFVYNAQLSLTIVLQKGLAQKVFPLWMTLLDRLPRMHDKKLAAVALCELLRLGLPEPLRAGTRNIVLGLVHLLSRLVDQTHQIREEQQALADEEAESDDEAVEADGDEEENAEEVPDDQDVGDESNSLKLLSYSAAAARENSEKLEDEDDYTSPLDSVDECGLFLNVVNEFVAREGDFARSIIDSLGPQERELLTKIQQRHQEFQEELAKAAQEAAQQHE